jgi:hypothetical protein
MKTRKPVLWKCPKCKVRKPKEEFLDFMYHDDSHECCKCAEAREKANEAYLDSPAFHAKCEAKREKAKKELEDTKYYEGKCSSCCSPVWISVKKGTVIKGNNLNCDCGDIGRMADNDYFRRMG